MVIEWKNIYYMLCYCVDEIAYLDDSLIDNEDIKSTNDLLAKLLINSFEHLHRKGYIKKYRTETIVTDKPHGRIDIAKSISTGTYFKASLACSVDTMDINNRLNQIIKSTISLLINSNNIIEDKISTKLLTELYFCKNILKDVDTIRLDASILNEKLSIPQWYKPVMSICKIIINEWIALDSEGNTRLLELNNERRLYYIWEKFVRNLISKEIALDYNVTKPSYRISAKKKINPDILIYKKNNLKMIVADCKWYEYTESTNANMYQAVTYGEIISDKYIDKEVTSLLLYASNNETIMSDIRDKDDNKGRFIVEEWQINVNQEFRFIKQDIKNIILKHC